MFIRLGDLMRKFGVFIAMGVVILGIASAFGAFESWNSGKSMADYSPLDETEKEIWRGIVRFCGPGNDDVALYACRLHRDELVEYLSGIRPMAGKLETQGQTTGSEATQMGRAAQAAEPILKELRGTLGEPNKEPT